MPATPDDLFAFLNQLGISYETHHHPPLFTVEDSQALRGELPGGHCKNLFLKDKRGSLWLVVALEDSKVDLKRLGKVLGAKNLSFGKPELLMEVLGVSPGAVTPFALINDREEMRVSLVLDEPMMRNELLNYHPLSNEMTVAIARQDLERFVAACGHRPEVLDLQAIADEEEAA